MKNYTKIILVALAVFAISADAVTATSLTVSPGTLSKKAGDSFAVSVGITTGGSKVCVVEGTLALDKLSCSSITVADGLMAQTTPTCAKPTFSIGIPSCATTDKTLFSVIVNAPTAGTATLGFTAVDIIGEGVSLGSSAGKGTYTVASASVEPVVPVVTETVVPKPVVKPAVTKTQETTGGMKPNAKVPEKINTAIEPLTTSAPTPSKNLAAAGTATQGVPLPWVVGIGVLALALGYFTAKKMTRLR
jgi:hypothetical protein